MHVLSTSVQVCYKVTDLLDDQILLTGLAAGGLTEVPMSKYRTASFGVTLAMEMGLFGLKPEVIMSCLMQSTPFRQAGKRAWFAKMCVQCCSWSEQSYLACSMRGACIMLATGVQASMHLYLPR